MCMRMNRNSPLKSVTEFSWLLVHSIEFMVSLQLLVSLVAA